MTGRTERSTRDAEAVSLRRENRNRTVRWLGVLLPLMLSCPALPIDGFATWLRPRIIAALASWALLAIVLLIRRDWRGAAAITAFYVIVDAWWTLLGFGVIRLGD